MKNFNSVVVSLSLPAIRFATMKDSLSNEPIGYGLCLIEINKKSLPIKVVFKKDTLPHLLKALNKKNFVKFTAFCEFGEFEKELVLNAYEVSQITGTKKEDDEKAIFKVVED